MERVAEISGGSFEDVLVEHGAWIAALERQMLDLYAEIDELKERLDEQDERMEMAGV